MVNITIIWELLVLWSALLLCGSCGCYGQHYYYVGVVGVMVNITIIWELLVLWSALLLSGSSHIVRRSQAIWTNLVLVRDQFLTSDFYMKEHTKPIFKDKKILILYNVYHYTSMCELMKILKYECPKPLHDSFSKSSRNKRNLIILPPHKNNQFSYKSAVLWNKLLRPLKIPSL